MTTASLVRDDGTLPTPDKLPNHYHIVQPLTAVEGWYAYYMVAEERRVMVLPLVGWAVVTYKTGSDRQHVVAASRGIPANYTEELRPFVATLMGQLVDYRDIPFPLICVLGPAVKDHSAVVRAQLKEADIDTTSIASN